jgi:hypothetical protein
MLSVKESNWSQENIQYFEKVQKETKGQKLRRMTSKQLKIWLLKA